MEVGEKGVSLKTLKKVMDFNSIKLEKSLKNIRYDARFITDFNGNRTYISNQTEKKC